MAGQRKGKLKFLVLSLFVVFLSSSVPLIVCEVESGNGYDPHEILIQKLDELAVSVKNIGEIVNRLESRLIESHSELGIGNGDLGSEKLGLGLEEIEIDDSLVKEIEIDRDGSEKLGVAVEEGENHGERRLVDDGDGSIGAVERPGAVSVATRFNPFWSEKFQFVSAVKLNSDAKSIHVLPFRDQEGVSKYIAVGDERGVIHVFSRVGEVFVEFDTLSEFSITAMVSYASRNESVLITGHCDGVVLMHRLWERSSEDSNSLSLVMENVGRFASRGSSTVCNLEVHYVGRARYVLSTDVSGVIRVFKEDGTLHGSVTPRSKPLAFTKQRVMFLTETGAGSLDLRSMRLRESECEGMNGSRARNYAFDATERSRAYGLASSGDLFYVSLLGDVVNFKCRVRFRRRLDVDEPVGFRAMKGYLLVVSEERVSVYNVSALHRVGGPRLLSSVGLDEIRSSFLNHQRPGAMVPLVTTDGERLVVLGLGDGYVGTYRSNLPVPRGEPSAGLVWTSPVLLFVIFLFGAWHFFAKKKDALTSWGPDDPFVGPSSRNADVNLRAAALRRYGSPNRYHHHPSSFRASAGDPNPRTTGSTVDPSFNPNPRPGSAVDSGFRAGTELKFRGSALESGGYQKRREGLSVSSQGLD